MVATVSKYLLTYKPFLEAKAALEAQVREFETGATRDDATGKPDYRGYCSPLALKRFGQYMLEHQMQANGTVRASDNWKKGMPRQEFLSSLLRHTIDAWDLWESGTDGKELEDLLCACWFNIQGLLHETLKRRDHETPV